MKTAFSFVDHRDHGCGGWRVVSAIVYAGHKVVIHNVETVILDENWIGSVEVGQLVSPASPIDGKPMFRAWWASDKRGHDDA